MNISLFYLLSLIVSHNTKSLHPSDLDFLFFSWSVKQTEGAEHQIAMILYRQPGTNIHLRTLMRSLEGYHEIRIMCHVKLSYLSEYYLMLFEHHWPCALHNYVWGFKTTIKLHLALTRALSIIY